MNNVIYIAGPMRGLIDNGKENFRMAEEYLKGRFGWTVINPAVLPEGMNQEKYMPICLAMLREADSIGLLPGWENSVGAKLELDFARATGKRVIDLEEEYGFTYEDMKPQKDPEAGIAYETDKPQKATVNVKDLAKLLFIETPDLRYKSYITLKANLETLQHMVRKNLGAEAIGSQTERIGIIRDWLEDCEELNKDGRELLDQLVNDILTEEAGANG